MKLRGAIAPSNVHLPRVAEMMPHAPRSRNIAVFALLLLPAAACAQTVEGITHQEVYADSVSFRVPAAAGFDTTAFLNGAPAPVGVFVAVLAADYYELLVERRNQTSGATERSTTQFIVRSSERANSEWGLPPWVPYPPIPSAAGEFAGARLELVAPGAYPQGLEVPVVAWVLDATGKRVGVNGTISPPGLPGHSLEVRRGVGSALLPPASAAGTIAYDAGLGPLEASKAIAIEASTTWTNVSGTLPASASWGEDARIHVAADVTVPAGGTLTIGKGSVVRLAAGVEVHVNGRLEVNGTAAEPVVFAPVTRDAPWGGIRLRTAASVAVMERAILTGSGADPDWFDNNPGSGSAHHDEEPLIYVSNGARATLTDCYLIDNQGQGGHGEGGFLTLTRSLIQRAVTGGQYNGGSVTLEDSALIEFPSGNAPFADDDNDGLYLTGGAHFLTSSMIGWAGDDGVDSGSGAGGPVTVRGCWFESCYHEGMAWSESRLPDVRDTVTMNNGQGMECGFGSPQVMADHILSTGNLSGARFGDNYDWDYDGFLTVTNSLLLFNRRDVWGRAWDDWTEHFDQMDIQGNFLSAPNPGFPSNSVWQPAVDASRLVPFLPSPAATVGMGIALRDAALDISEARAGVPVRLSTFTTSLVSVDYSVDSEDGSLGGGTLQFVPGETVKWIEIEADDLAAVDLIDVSLSSPVNAELTGRETQTFFRAIPETLVAAGAVWKYWDRGQDLGTAWRDPDFVDGAWPMGPAELGFGDDDEDTPINGGPANARYPTTYFRHRFEVLDPSAFRTLRINLVRDDGAIVYLNGVEVFRSNIREGNVGFSTLAVTSSTSETAFFSKTAGTEALVPGTNVVAVEVHQASADSSDLGFALELIGNRAAAAAPGFVRGDAARDGTVNISDAVKTLLVLFAGETTDCEDALDGDDDGLLQITDAIYVLDFLFRGGTGIAAPYPDPGPDPTEDALGCER
jgi:hypothetical protein